MISDEQLLKYWRDPNFFGSYRGARTFQVLLKTDLNIDVPLSRINEVLKKGMCSIRVYDITKRNVSF